MSSPFVGSFTEDVGENDVERREREKRERNDPLSYLSRDMPLCDRKWLIGERVPMRNVTLLSGDGGVGKTVVLMQLAAATVLGKDWLGMRPSVGPVQYFGAEDDSDELRRRFENIAKHYCATWEDLFDAGLRTLSFAGTDALLGKPDRDGIITATPLLTRLHEAAIALKPKLIIIDPAADVFAGKEIDRAQVRQFISLLRAIAIAVDCAVILAAHPSLTGMRERTGLSGSTAWANSVRARFYLTKPKSNGDSDDDAPDAGLRVLECKKNNYGPLTASIPIRWQEGVFVVAAKDAFDQTVAEVHAEEVFLTLLRQFAAQGRNVTDKHSPSYAPARFAEQTEARSGGLNTKALAAAMDRLFTAGRIKAVTEGPPSRLRTRLIEAASNAPSNTLPTPSNTPENPSNGVCSHTPLVPPSPLEAGKGALEGPPAPPGDEEGNRARRNTGGSQ
jgi:RecA-family ATPase